MHTRKNVDEENHKQEDCLNKRDSQWPLVPFQLDSLIRRNGWNKGWVSSWVEIEGENMNCCLILFFTLMPASGIVWDCTIEREKMWGLVCGSLTALSWFFFPKRGGLYLLPKTGVCMLWLRTTMLGRPVQWTTKASRKVVWEEPIMMGASLAVACRPITRTQ